MRRTVALAMVVAASMLGVSACGGAQGVTVVHVHARDIAAQPGGVGTVAASVQVPITLDFRDTVTGVHVISGDTVTAGEALLDLDPAPLTANAQQLQLRADGAVGSLQRAQLALASAVTKAPSTVSALQAQIQTLQGQIALNQDLVNIAHGVAPTVVSPINGIVNAVNVAAGQDPAAGEVLMQIVDFHRVTVTGHLPIAEQTAVVAGGPATVTFPAFPNVSLPGTVLAKSAGALDNGTTFALTVDLANTPDQRILPGISAYVRVRVTNHVAMTVPKAAVLNSDLNPTLVVVNGGVVHLRPVVLGSSDGQYVEIVSGVSANDVCVLVGSQGLNDGSSVRVDKDDG